MGAPNQNQQNQNQQQQQAPSGADRFFAAADHHMVGGRIGVDVAAGGIGAAAVFGLAHKGIGPFQKSPAHLIGGAVGGVVIVEGARALTVDKKKYAAARLSLIAADQQKWQKVADETK
jgi:hypothetical protein